MAPLHSQSTPTLAIIIDTDNKCPPGNHRPATPHSDAHEVSGLSCPSRRRNGRACTCTRRRWSTRAVAHTQTRTARTHTARQSKKKKSPVVPLPKQPPLPLWYPRMIHCTLHMHASIHMQARPDAGTRPAATHDKGLTHSKCGDSRATMGACLFLAVHSGTRCINSTLDALRLDVVDRQGPVPVFQGARGPAGEAPVRGGLPRAAPRTCAASAVPSPPRSVASRVAGCTCRHYVHPPSDLTPATCASSPRPPPQNHETLRSTGAPGKAQQTLSPRHIPTNM